MWLTLFIKGDVTGNQVVHVSTIPRNVGGILVLIRDSTGTITYKYKDSTYVTWERQDVDYEVNGYISFDEKGQPQIKWGYY